MPVAAITTAIHRKPPITRPSTDERVFEATWRRWLIHLAFQAWLDGRFPTATGGFTSWDCVASAETSGNWHAHGPKYSSALGMLNAAVRERADSPASSSRILAGTASRAEQIHAGAREVAHYGVHAWGARTVAGCT